MCVNAFLDPCVDTHISDSRVGGAGGGGAHDSWLVLLLARANPNKTTFLSLNSQDLVFSEGGIVGGGDVMTS